MKEIKFDGLAVKGMLSVNSVGGSEVSASKISAEGMLFETTTKLNIHGHYKFRIICSDKELVIAAKVLNVLLKGTVKKNNRNYQRYQVAVEFKQIGNKEKTFLDTIIGRILDNDILLPSEEIQGAKIHIKD